MIEIIKSPGIWEQVSERLGQGHLGVTRGGPVDLKSYLWTKYLLENCKSTQVFEFFGQGHTLKVQTSCIGALCGAVGRVTVNDKEWSNWSSRKFETGDLIQLENIDVGSWFYLGFSQRSELSSYRKRVPNHLKPRNSPKIRFLANENASNTLVEGFKSLSFKRGLEFSRMGIRLSGASIEHELGGNQSEALSLGTIQLPRGGRPIILGPEHQTIGGYLRLGQVFPFDLGRLYQAMPEDQFQFVEVSIQEARERFKEMSQFFHWP